MSFTAARGGESPAAALGALDGRMIDAATVRMAERLLAHAEALARRS